jgi:hypothetical protein
MKLSKKSKQLMLFFTKNRHIHNIEQTAKTNAIIKELYNDILESYNFVLHLKNTKKNYYNLTIQNIITVSQITKPKHYNADSFPQIIRNHIDDNTVSEISYTFSLFGKNIKIFFIVEDNHVELKLDTYNTYVDHIVMWLYILNQYASKQCAQTITLYFYFTSLEKHLPKSNIVILDEINVNTAFTTTCPKDAEIVVFRKEEWFKVFIHETFHNFGLDFSDMNNDIVHRCILNIFNVQSDVNLYESYTEFWAEIINALFCSFIALKNKHNVEEFLSNSEFYINIERGYSFFQLVKTLHFMGLQYSDLYSKTEHSKINRNNLYKEKTNVLSYYIIKTILINNYPSFLQWCKIHNLSLLQFRKTLFNQNDYCMFIKKNYKTKSMIESVKNTQLLLSKVIKKNDDKKNKNNKNMYNLLSNLRMSICELG